MFDTFPYESWLTPDGKSLNQDIGGFWTWGPGDTTGTYILTALGMLLMIVAIIGWVLLEKKKLDEQAARLRAAGSPLPGGGAGD